jgi:hypothetical protein
LQITECNGLSGHLHCIVLLTESGGRQMAESSLLSDAVVEDLDAFRDLAFGLLASFFFAIVHQIIETHRSKATGRTT